MKTHKITQAETAKIIGIPVGTLRNWIYNNRIPDVETACDLAVILGVTVDYLVYGKDRKPTEERMSRLLERKTAAARINKLAKVILDQSKQI
jgi:transcriptional regulator with XRE-family HTH domain